MRLAKINSADMGQEALIFILTRHKAKLYDFLDPVIDDIARELQGEVDEHDREWITDEVQRQMLEVGVYVFTEMGKKKAKEIVREIVESVLAGNE